MMVNNETGICYPVEEIAQAVKAKNPGCLVHCDAIQGFLKLPFHLGAGKEGQALRHIDLLSISGHKIYAPKGIGGLFLRKGVKLPPLLHGGGQEEGLRSGTQATSQMAAMVAATQDSVRHFSQRDQQIKALHQQISQALSQMEGVRLINPPQVATVPNILPFSLVGYPSQVVLRFLSDLDICLSAGSACHRGGESHVFSALPLDPKIRMGVLRLSLSHLSKQEDLSALLSGLAQAKAQLIPSF